MGLILVHDERVEKSCSWKLVEVLGARRVVLDVFPTEEAAREAADFEFGETIDRTEVLKLKGDTPHAAGEA